MEPLEVAADLLRDSAPHQLADTAVELLRTRFGALDAEVLLVDYGMTALLPVAVAACEERSVPVHTGDAGRAFGTQRPVIGAPGPATTDVHLPLTVRGDRQGVVSVRLPAGGTAVAGRLADLESFARVLAHELVVADRGTDHFLRRRRTGRLTLAAEMQWELLPGRACSRPEYLLGAQLEPAYAVHGDTYDWTTAPGRLTVTVANGMGTGMEAALLANLCIGALRNARRAGIPLADQAALADQAVYAQYSGRLHSSVLMLEFDSVNGIAHAVDAGSPRILRCRSGEVVEIDLDAQLPLGMFEETHYRAQTFDIAPGDRLVVVSDGVHEARSPRGRQYAEAALGRAVASTRLAPATDVPGLILRELADYRGGSATQDDAVVLCLDWRGPQPLTPLPAPRPPGSM